MYLRSRKHKHAKATLGLGSLLALLAVGGAAASYLLRSRREEGSLQQQDAARPITEDEMNRPNGTTYAGSPADTAGLDPLPRDSI